MSIRYPAAIVLLSMLVSPLCAQSTVERELDSYWNEVSRTVAEGDFEGYAALYHPDAVLVNLGDARSYPISEALAGWESGFVDTREGRGDADVEFRLSQRLNSATTAHETGIFRYTFTPDGGEPTIKMVHFTALLVMKEGEWLMVMEYQGKPATEEEWDEMGS